MQAELKRQWVITLENESEYREMIVMLKNRIHDISEGTQDDYRAEPMQTWLEAICDAI